MKIETGPAKLNNEAAQITLAGRDTTNGSWLTKKINPRRCADLHSWCGWKIGLGRAELSAHKKAGEELGLNEEMPNGERASQGENDTKGTDPQQGQGQPSACVPA